MTKAEQERSEKESVTHQFEICISCGAMADDRTAHFELIGVDKNLNVSRDYMGVTVDEAQFRACCGNMPKKPVRPIPKRKK